MRFIDAPTVASLGPARAVAAILDALRGGLDPSTDPARVAVGLSHGQFLLMPSEVPSAVGVKVVTVAPHNPEHGLARIQAAYLLFDQQTLTMRAVLDGTALTSLRTPAVSIGAALTRLPQRPLRAVIVGSGPQAVSHAAALAAVRNLADVTYLVRDPARVEFASVALSSDAAHVALRAADVVVCATSAREPMFDSSLIADSAVVIAVGSHEADARELDAALLERSTVLVEEIGTALREAGDVVMAIAEGAISERELVTLRDVVTDAVVVPSDRPLVVKTVGMSWQDLVIAEAVMALVD